MNWKNVAHLIRVDMKSGRLIRGRRLTKYRENKLFTYVLYGGALILGLAVGVLAGLVYNSVSVADQQFGALFNQGLLDLFLSLPTLVMIYSMVFTMMQQIQRSGVKFSVQAPYWLPITWEEHTLASALANLLGFPLASIVFIGSAIIVVSVFVGQTAYAVLTLFALLASAFIASAITEILRTLQVRFIGAVYKSSGRAAVWVRFVGSLLFFILFYIGYFFITSGVGAIAFVQTIASAQSAVWFIPFVWLGMTLYSFINGLFLHTVVFLTLSLLFTLGLFYMAVILNRRFGLYEPPAITVSRGVYAPKAGFLGRLGFSTVEAALIRKDLKAFTRRRELMYIFVLPVVFILIPLMQAMGATGNPMPTEAVPFLFALVFIMPSAAIAIFMGNLMIGEEGGAVWRIYSAPISAKSLVKSKYFFIVFFSVLVTVLTGIVGIAAFRPTLRTSLVALVESLLMILALGALSLASGIKGADFTELPRPRMIRTMWAIINLIVCLLAALAILAPIVAYAFTRILPFVSIKPLIDLYPAIGISTVITIIIAFFAYRWALQNARELLTKAEI
jgi:hypothetical protein